jgi:hypothetical protein
MCRVCNKRPEVPGERYDRCEACAKAGRIVYRFRLGVRPAGSLVVRAGELSPRALRQKLHTQLGGFAGHPSTKPHLTLHDVEVVLAKDRLESIRVAPSLAGRDADVLAALSAAAERTDAAW